MALAQQTQSCPNCDKDGKIIKENGESAETKDQLTKLEENFLSELSATWSKESGTKIEFLNLASVHNVLVTIYKKDKRDIVIDPNCNCKKLPPSLLKIQNALTPEVRHKFDLLVDAKGFDEFILLKNLPNPTGIIQDFKVMFDDEDLKAKD